MKPINLKSTSEGFKNSKNYSLDMARCSCGTNLESEKSLHEITVHLSNPGSVKFEAEGKKCSKCNSHVFSESDADKIFSSFDKARKEQHH